MISGQQCIKILCKYFGGQVVSQKGSHIKVRFLTGLSVPVPNHKELNRFTLKGILDLAQISPSDFFNHL